MIVDFHTHAFPDRIADRAMAALSAEVPGIAYYLDGRVSSLLDSMDRAGVDVSVVASIATRPEQVGPILDWSMSIASERLVPFASVHPKDPDAVDWVRRIAQAGLKGVKMHPYYQDFDLDADDMRGIWEAVAEQDLLLLMHTGYDIAFERVDKAGPGRIVNVLEQVPGLRLVTTHLGAWEQWDAVQTKLIGKKIPMDISYTRNFLGQERMREMIVRHPEDMVLFGTDSPWEDQAEAIRKVRQFNLNDDRMGRLLGNNAACLLNLNY